ncbi:hypothetical protein B0H13DRAFT_2317289 [Mycena leptocephala]|nr:hypothetical protein B0H13DRAFT_2317289 [Mycena leptocephala]
MSREPKLNKELHEMMKIDVAVIQFNWVLIVVPVPLGALWDIKHLCKELRLLF